MGGLSIWAAELQSSRKPNIRIKTSLYLFADILVTKFSLKQDKNSRFFHVLFTTNMLVRKVWI